MPYTVIIKTNAPKALISIVNETVTPTLTNQNWSSSQHADMAAVDAFLTGEGIDYTTTHKKVYVPND